MNLRVMWLLNHTTARKFEISMLKSIGIQEIFLPKLFPSEQEFRSCSVDWSEDKNLTIPADDLNILNSADWYSDDNAEAWKLANQYFDVCFCIFSNQVLTPATRYFQGALLMRTYGLAGTDSYAMLLDWMERRFNSENWNLINRMGDRFFVAKAYDHIDEIEPDVLKKRSVYLPLGLHNATINDKWQGKDKRIFFVCPCIGNNFYYEKLYSNFISDFDEYPYAIGGAQPIYVDDPAVLGFTAHEVHEENMRQMRLMFYHSTEPNHIHYHPFEAIRAGMPLVFMAGGMLDRMGGKTLPGRCETISDAQAKIKRILNDDWKLIENIRRSQTVLLEPMKAENAEGAWHLGFERIAKTLELSRLERNERNKRPIKPKRIAVIVPVPYKGGSLRGAKLLAQAIYEGSRQTSEPAEVIFFHLDDPAIYPKEEFADLLPGISRRAFVWRHLSTVEARQAMRYAGHSRWQPTANHYLVPDDGIKQLQDCDLWLLISNRFTSPLLPLRPRVFMVYDYLQRYVPVLPHAEYQPYLDVVRSATRMLVTTEFTRQDAMQYAGVSEKIVVKVPMLAPDFSGDFEEKPLPVVSTRSYFIWTTNAGMHKNHENALKALIWYYEELGGRLDCRVTGVDTIDIPKSELPHLAGVVKLLRNNKLLQKHLRWKGDLVEKNYRNTLCRAAFLWHPCKLDNGTFSVIEAASMGVPALSSDYPAMHEIDEQFALNLSWMDGNDPKAMATQLKNMEQTYMERRSLLPSKARLGEQSVSRLAGEYWKAVRACL